MDEYFINSIVYASTIQVRHYLYWDIELEA